MAVAARCYWWGGCYAFWLIPLAFAAGQTTLSGDGLIVKSTGSSSGGDWAIDRNGYVGTYIQLAEPGAVTIAVNAAGVASDGVDPHMNIVIADIKAGFDIASGFGQYEHTFNLPAGTYFVRTEFNNDREVSARQLVVRDITVTGADVRNQDVHAIAAANTYIDNYRKAAVTVALPGALPGESVDVRLTRHDFNFGTAVPGGGFNGVNNYLGNAGTARQTNYQARLNANFNAIVPENAGKWANNEGVRDSPQVANVDLLLDYAEAHNMNARMHNLIWGDNSSNGQQPGWVLNNNQNGLLDLAASGDANAAAELRAEISERIDYYVGDGPGGFEDHSRRYLELDVYNESFHTGAANSGGLGHNYWNVYGPQGVAGIYHEVQQSVAASSATTKLFVNEYSVLGNSSDYMRHIDALRQAGVDAGYGEILGGIGAQYYPSSAASHVPADIMASLQDYAVQGLPFALTEFGATTGVDTVTAAQVLEDIMRLVFGNPDSTGFYMWGFHRETGPGATGLFAPNAALYTVSTNNFNNWTLTPAGVRYQWLFGRGLDPSRALGGRNSNPWTTDLTTIVDEDGTIQFKGFFGEYDLEIGGRIYRLELTKGTELYSLVVVPEPTAQWLGLVACAAVSAGRLRMRTNRSRRAT